MASIHKEITIDARPEDVWDALRDFGAVHERLAPGFVVDARLDGDDARIVTFFTGSVAREVLVGVDEEARRLAYSVVEGPLPVTHHNASAQVLADGDGQARFVWITDVLPDAVAPHVDGLMAQGIAVIKQALEAQGAGLSRS
ncbi:MAG: SRPBCC family protein [Actinomycetota bacterium]|nr:SRPBCC family protein [Actinomycetota bacterium]